MNQEEFKQDVSKNAKEYADSVLLEIKDVVSKDEYAEMHRNICNIFIEGANSVIRFIKNKYKK